MSSHLQAGASHCTKSKLATAIFVFVCASLAATATTKSDRINLTPKFSPGESMAYDIETRTTTTGKTTSPITNSEAPTVSSLSVKLSEQLEVESVEPQPKGQSVTFRLTWSAAQAESRSDALDPTASDPAAIFDKLQGQSVELTLDPEGGISNFKGLENIVPGGVPPAESVAWIASLSAPASFPAGGISIGQQWKAETPIAGAPLTGLFWRTQSTYQRDEECAALPGHQCAVILSEMAIARQGEAHGDATPPDYLHNGLRTSGTWTGSGEELGSILIDSGLLVAATESSTQDMDYGIKSAATGSAVHYTAKVENETGVTLVELSKSSAKTVH